MTTTVIQLLYVQEILAQFISKLLCKMGQDFFDIQFIICENMQIKPTLL